MTVEEFVRTHMENLAAESDKCTAVSSSACEEGDQNNEEVDPEYAPHLPSEAAIQRSILNSE